MLDPYGGPRETSCIGQDCRRYLPAMTDREAKAALAYCRSRIDVVDRHIVSLLNERTRIVEEIGRVKRKMQMPIYEPKREDEVFANDKAANTGRLSPEAVKRIFERIIDEMRVVQKNKMETETQC